jgi:hypothetical protein
MTTSFRPTPAGVRLCAAALIAGAAAVASPAADLCKGLVQDRAPHPMTPLARPALGQAVRDPQFGVRLRRITAVSPGGATDAAVRPLYSTVSAWNADESRLLLYRVGGGHQLYDGRTYAFIRALGIAPNDIEQVYWHTSDPDVFFFPSGNRLVRYRVSTAAQETVRVFGFCNGPVSAGPDPMFTAWDSSALGLACGGRGFVYQLSTDTVRGLDAGVGAAPQVAPGGALAWVGGEVRDLDLRFLRRLDLGNPLEHAMLGRTAAGRDTFDTVAFDPGPAGSGVGSLVTFDLQSGSARVVVGPATGYPYPPSGTHVSTLAYREPGWAFLSIVGDPTGQGVLDNELVLAHTGGGPVCRLAHHRSWGRHNTRLQDSYWAEPHVVASPTGTRALYASDWGNGATVDAYVLELPGYQPLRLAVATDRAAYTAGTTMTVSTTTANLGLPESADLYFTVVLPDGDQAVSLTPSGSVFGRVSQPSSLVPLVTGLDLRRPFQSSLASFLTHTWTGGEPAGTYMLVAAAFRPGSLADNRIDADDLIAMGMARPAFTR